MLALKLVCNSRNGQPLFVFFILGSFAAPLAGHVRVNTYTPTHIKQAYISTSASSAFLAPFRAAK